MSFQIPKLPDLRPQALQGRTPTDEEYKQILEYVRAHRQAMVEKAETKSRQKYVDLSNF